MPYLLPDSRSQNTVRTCGLGLAPSCLNSAASLQIEELPAGVVVRIKKRPRVQSQKAPRRPVRHPSNQLLRSPTFTSPTAGRAPSRTSRCWRRRRGGRPRRALAAYTPRNRCSLTALAASSDGPQPSTFQVDSSLHHGAPEPQLPHLDRQWLAIAHGAPVHVPPAVECGDPQPPAFQVDRSLHHAAP